MTFAETGLILAGAYSVVGVGFAIAFVLRGAGVIDPVAAHSGWGFRLLIMPGAVALWPLLLAKWASAVRRQGGPS